MVLVRVLVSPAGFVRTILARTRSLRLRLSCLTAARLSLSFTVARPAVPVRKLFLAILITRAARAMFAVRVATPRFPGSPRTTRVSTPRWLIFARTIFAFDGGCGGGGGGG